MQPQLLQSQRMLRPNTTGAQFSTDVIREQRDLNKKNAERYASGKIQNATLRQLLADSGGALETTLKLLNGNNKPVSLHNFFTSGDNVLRGWGFILVAFSSVALLIQVAAS